MTTTATTPLVHDFLRALFDNDHERLRALLRMCPHRVNGPPHLLATAVAWGRPEAVRLLLAAKAIPSAERSYGHNLLCVAVRNCAPWHVWSVGCMLLEAGAPWPDSVREAEGDERCHLVTLSLCRQRLAACQLARRTLEVLPGLPLCHDTRRMVSAAIWATRRRREWLRDDDDF